MFLHWDDIHDKTVIDLHPLSLESLLHVPGGPHSGANYYKEHLFIHVLSHTLNKEGDEEPNLLEQIVRSLSPEPFEPEDEVEAPPKYSAEDTPHPSGFTSKLHNTLKLPRRSGTAKSGGGDVENVDVTKALIYADYGSHYATYVRLLPPSLVSLVVTSFSSPFPETTGYKNNKSVHKLMQELKEGGRVNVAIKPVCVFLFKDGAYNRDRFPATVLHVTYQHWGPSSRSTPTTT